MVHGLALTAVLHLCWALMCALPAGAQTQSARASKDGDEAQQTPQQAPILFGAAQSSAPPRPGASTAQAIGGSGASAAAPGSPAASASAPSAKPASAARPTQPLPPRPAELVLAKRLNPSALTPPLHEMRVRWDGRQVAAGGLRAFDSPRFGMVRDGGARPHAGIDLDAPVGTPVFAVATGIVDLARYGDALYGHDIMLAFKPEAHMLAYLKTSGQALSSSGLLFAHYAHLSAVFVETGQVVQRGTLIGRTGISGNADQKYPHLHFELRKTRWPGAGAEGLRARVDPELLFKVDFSTPVEAATREGPSPATRAAPARPKPAATSTPTGTPSPSTTN